MMKKNSNKKWYKLILRSLGIAIFIPVIVYIIYPDMTTRTGWILIGVSLFLLELIGLCLDYLFGYKKTIADFFNRKKKKD
jgi:hypothetical protein